MKKTFVASATSSASQMGFWVAMLTSLCSVSALAIAATTAPARSGPFCMVDSCITYPYTDVAAFVPIDYIWMYPAFLMMPAFVVLIACIHYYASTDKKIFSLIALCFATIATSTLATNYFIQLAVVQPSLLKGEVERLSLLSQYNPHGVFIALEDIGYLMVGIALLFAATVFDRPQRLERAIRFLFVTSGVLAVGSLVVLSFLYRSDLEYRYEVAVILIDWIALIVSGILLSLFFKQDGQNLKEETT